MNETAFFARITGRVQNVGFRYSCQGAAQEQGLSGWVRNAEDGSVEVWCEGDPEKQKAFIAWLHRGSSYSRVDSVEISPAKFTGAYKNFSIR
jgi:acylphosphatase